MLRDPVDFFLRKLERRVLDLHPLFLDETGELFLTRFVKRDLDACLVLVVASTELVIDAKYRF